MNASDSTPRNDDLDNHEDQPGERFPDMEDALDEPNADQLLDSGYSPPERPRGLNAWGTTVNEQREGETIDRRLLQEEPEDTWDGRNDDDDADPTAVGRERAGRLREGESDVFGTDVGVDGAGASAEEAAVHIIDSDDDLEERDI